MEGLYDMHNTVREWVARWMPQEAELVLDFGGADVNGSVRDLTPSESRYLAIDPYGGEGVDVRADARSYVHPELADVVLCLEVFEHVASWQQFVFNAAERLRPAGLFIATCAGPRRAPHSARGFDKIEEGEYYANVHPQELEWTLMAAGFARYEVGLARGGHDVQAWAQR